SRRARPRRARARAASLRRSRRLPDALDDDFDGCDGEPGEPLDLVRDLTAHGRCDLGEVEAVLHDDVQLDPKRIRSALDADLVAAEHAAHATAGAQPDDAVAAERGLGDDLRHRLTPD